MSQTSASLATPAAWECFSQSVAPVAYANTLGAHIALSQPDVEVMAVVLSEVPLTPEKFALMDAGRGWISMAFTVLQVGPPGFSSVPYTATKKEKESNPLRLYEVDDTGSTKFHSFEKGKSNKDKGVRVSTLEAEETGQPLVDATIRLEHGVMMSTFMRAEDFAVAGDERFPKTFALDDTFEGLDAIPANTVVYMQLSASNIEQAKKHQGLKVRKIKSLGPRESVLGSCFASLPFGESACSALMDRSRLQHSLSGMLYRHTLRTFALRPKSTAYAVQDDEGYFVLCDADDGIDEIRFTKKQLLGLVGSGLSLDDAMAVVNIGLSMQAIRLLVVLDTSSVKTLQGDINYEAAVMELDVNQCLQLSTLSQFGSWPSVPTSTPCSEALAMRVHKLDESVMWSNPAFVHTTPRQERKHIVFDLQTNVQDSESDSVREYQTLSPLVDTQHFLDSQMAGPFQAITIYIASADIASADFFADAGTQKVVQLEMRVENRKASMGKKRKRPDLVMKPR